MSNETKCDVFDAVWNRLAGYQVFFNGWPRETLDGYKKRYDNALPDDLPVIPKEVGEWLTWCKEQGHSLKDALDCETRVSEDTFALAWVIGVWEVEETGEIVKFMED